MNEETVKHDIRLKRQKLNSLALQISTKKIELRRMERKRDELKDQIFTLSEVLPKIEREERRMRIVSERLQNTQ